MKNFLKNTIKNAIVTYFKPIRWLLGLFKRKPKPIPQKERSEQEIKNDKHRAKYRTEVVDGVHFIQYYFNGEWWYLRLFDEDYILEEKRGKGMRLTDLQYLENIITKHQEWLSGGRIFLPFK